MFTANINVSVSGQVGGSYSTSSIVAAGLRKSLFEEIPAGATTEVIFDLDVSQTKLLVMRSDKDLIINTNNATTPDNVITLIADQSFLWPIGGSALKDTSATPIVADIVSLFVDNATADLATLRVDAFVDPTI